MIYADEIRDITESVERENGVKLNRILARYRPSARQYLILCQFARRLRGRKVDGEFLSLPRIGRIMGKDHTSVLAMLGGGKKKKHA